MKPKPVDSKEKKKSHKSKKGEKAKEKDIKPGKKRDWSASPAPKLSTTSKQGRTVSPPAVSSSGPESVKQSGIALDSHHTASFSNKDTTGMTGQVSSGAQSSG